MEPRESNVALSSDRDESPDQVPAMFPPVSQIGFPSYRISRRYQPLMGYLKCRILGRIGFLQPTLLVPHVQVSALVQLINPIAHASTPNELLRLQWGVLVVYPTLRRELP